MLPRRLPSLPLPAETLHLELVILHKFDEALQMRYAWHPSGGHTIPSGCDLLSYPLKFSLSLRLLFKASFVLCIVSLFILHR